MEIPSYVLVPRPISSKSTKLRGERLFRILAVSFISTMKVDSPEEMLSDRKSTRLNSSHVRISYAVFCLKKKTKRVVVARFAGRRADFTARAAAAHLDAFAVRRLRYEDAGRRRRRRQSACIYLLHRQIGQ